MALQNGATRHQVKRWKRNLAEERAEAVVYRKLARRRTGEEQAILLALADAEDRHAAHWEDLLADEGASSVRPPLRSRLVLSLAQMFGSVFVLALMQASEERNSRYMDEDATEAMAADEHIHGEVVRALAAHSRARMSGTFRAAVFGTNDGLVSNLALVLGIGAAGVSNQVIMLTGLSGLLAGALSMAAGEYVSVRSQRELLEASTPDPDTINVLPALDINANELALVYRARGISAIEAAERARNVISTHNIPGQAGRPDDGDDDGERAFGPGSALQRDEGQTADSPPSRERAAQEYEEIGNGWSAALSSFLFFATGAIIPVIPYLVGLSGWAAVAIAAGVVGVALMITGGIVGILSGVSPWPRAFRQVAIGYGAAAATYLLGLAFGVAAA